jgi:hypothetical protein
MIIYFVTATKLSLLLFLRKLCAVILLCVCVEAGFLIQHAFRKPINLHHIGLSEQERRSAKMTL